MRSHSACATFAHEICAVGCVQGGSPLHLSNGIAGHPFESPKTAPNVRGDRKMRNLQFIRHLRAI
jgi:hypothetical protein